MVISNVNKGKLDFSETRFVPQDYYDKLTDTRKPESGDVLYTLVGTYGIPVLVDTDGVTSRAARDCRRPRPTARQGRRSPTVGGVGAGSHRQHEAVNPRAGVPWGTWGVTSRAGCVVAERLLATTLLFLFLCLFFVLGELGSLVRQRIAAFYYVI